ncbi:MAG: ATP-binding protein [Serpentinimonas sp.]|nr:ATP-binding protein [Serpentinimonas sp.]
MKPDLYEPELNPVYAATLAHYGVVADPARVRDPNCKGTVEHAIGHTQATALKGRRFESIEAQNEFLAQWEKNWAAKRISSYAAPPAAIGSKVLVRIYAQRIEIRDIHTRALLRTHAKAERPGTVVLAMKERVFNPSRETRLILRQAGEIGEHAAEVLQAIVHQRYKLRRSIVITSNRVLQDWGKYLGDATMATTILDRLMHRCTMLEFEGKSYRLKEAAARIAISPEAS